MPEDKVKCPKCGHIFAIASALSEDIEERLRGEFDARLSAAAKEKNDADAAWRKKLAAKDEEYEGMLTAAKKELLQQAEKRARAETQSELETVQDQLKQSNQQLSAAKKRELSLRLKEQELQQRAEDIKLETAQRLAAERSKINKAAETRVLEQHHLKDAEKDRQLADMRKQIDALQRKAEQGSQKLQGEVLEEDLEALLTAAFPTDDIRPVAGGKRGGDIVHAIAAKGGQQAGRILWEAKNTKAWSDAWLDKARQDQRAEKAEEVIIVSTVLPKGVAHFGQVEGVWVSEPVYAIGFATVLRAEIVKLGAAWASNGDRSDKMEQLYGYLCGTEFRQRVEAIVECFGAMQEELEQEKRAMERSWAKRGKQLERVLKSTAGMYGDLQGIIGRQALPTVKPLALPGG